MRRNIIVAANIALHQKNRWKQWALTKFIATYCGVRKIVENDR
jgi:hypothetical protein